MLQLGLEIYPIYILSFAVQAFSVCRYREKTTPPMQVSSSGGHFFNQQQRVCMFFAARSKRDHARDDRTYSTVGSCNGQSHACYIVPFRSGKAWKLYTTYHGIRPLTVAGLYTGPAIQVFTVLYVCVVFPAMHVIILILLYN